MDCFGREDGRKDIRINFCTLILLVGRYLATEFLLENRVRKVFTYLSEESRGVNSIS